MKFRCNHFMLSDKQIIDKVCNCCEFPCRASLCLPKETMKFHTETKPTVVRFNLSTNIMEEAGQRILMVRENITSMTATAIVKNQSIPELRDHLVSLSLSLKLTKSAFIRTDAHKSFLNLKDDTYLKSVGITIDVGNPKNINKNRVAKKAIREL